MSAMAWYDIVAIIGVFCLLVGTICPWRIVARLFYIFGYLLYIAVGVGLHCVELCFTAALLAGLEVLILVVEQVSARTASRRPVRQVQICNGDDAEMFQCEHIAYIVDRFNNEK